MYNCNYFENRTTFITKMIVEKKAIRKQIRELKMRYSLEEKKQMSLSVWQQVEQSAVFQKSQIVLAYWSMDDEVYTHDFVCKWARQKTILLPCVRGDELEVRYFEGQEKLVAGEGYAIPEPVGQLFEDLSRIDLVLVPGVAFDRLQNRLGRGKGYYDKILSQTNTYKLGVCFDFQFLDQLPVEEHDIKMSQVIHS